MVTRNVVLTAPQAAFLDELVETGRFQNVSEAMRAGLRLLEAQETEWQRVRAGVLEGLEQARRGEVVEGTAEAIFERAFAEAQTAFESK